MIPAGVKMKVTETPERSPKHRCGAVFGPNLSTNKYTMFDNNLVNTTRGLLERVFLLKKASGYEVPRRPNKKLFNKVLATEKRMLTNGPLFKPWHIKDVLPLWSGPKHRTYVSAYNSLKVRPLTRSDGYLKTFTKVEKVSKNKADPVPRVIQPRSPRYNLHLARFLKPYEKDYYKRIDRMWDSDGYGDKTVFKGMNASQVATEMLKKASRFSDPVFIGLDASRFDQHVSDIALQWEHSVYLDNTAYDKPTLATLLSWQVRNIGKAHFPEGKIEYTVEGRRMSGDMNTSLGNCMLMSSMVHAYMRSKRIKSSLSNNGDDCVLMFEKKHLNKLGDLSDWFAKLGFDMVVEEPLYDIRKVPFCQMHVLTGVDYNIAVRDPEVACSKDLHSTYWFKKDNDYLEWLSSVGICGYESTRGVPVLESFYSAFPKIEITNYHFKLEMERERTYCHVGGSKNVAISDEMRHSFWVAFGITPDSQVELEKYYNGMKFDDRVGDDRSLPLVSLFRQKY